MARSRASRRTRGARRVFLRRLIDFLILAAVLWLAFTLAGRSLRQIATTQIAELTNAKIKAESIDFNFDGSVSIEKLVIRPVLAAGEDGPEERPEYEDAILKADKVYARFDVGSLLMVRPRLREIAVSDFVFNAQYDFDAERWNTAGLKFNVAKRGAGQVPGVRLERGTLQYSRVSDGQVKVVTKLPVDVKFAPAEETRDTYSFSITTSETATAGKSTLNGSWQPGRITVTGGISSTDVPSLERALDIKVLAADLTYDANNAYSLKLKIKDFLSTPAAGRDTFASDEPVLLKSWGAFDSLRRFLRRYRPAGKIDIDLEASGSVKRPWEGGFSGKVLCKDVSIRDVKFPYLVEHIAGEVDFNQNKVAFSNLSGEHNDVNLTFDGWSADFGANRQYEIRIRSDNMALDSHLYDALNPEQKKFWSAFSPSGKAAIDYTIDRRAQNQEKAALRVELLDAVATYEKFPYPLKNLVGDLFFEADDITITDLVSQYEGRTITLNGKATGRSTDRPIYDLSISAKNIPLDSGLAAVLPAGQRNFYEQCNMTGLADAEVKIFTPEPNVGPTSFTADVSLKETSLQFEQLPLVIQDVSAKAVVGPNSIILEDFTGRYDQASVSLAGQIWPTDEAEQSRYCLTARVEQMELDDVNELLPASVKDVVSKWQLKGKVNLVADLNKAGGGDCPEHKLKVDCLGNSLNFRFTKAEPNDANVGFKLAAYPLKDVTGSLIITADSIKLDNITAAPANDMRVTADSPTIKINGEIALDDNAFSSGRLRLSANDIRFDERLGLALPEGLRGLYAKLAPAGRFDLELDDIKMSNDDDGQTDFYFSGTAKLKICNLNIWPSVAGLDAVLDMNGLYKTGSGFSEGQATILADSLKVSGKSVTALEADMNYDPQRQSWLIESLTADCHGGKLTGKFEFKQPVEEASEYLLQLGFVNIDLRQFLSEPNRSEASSVAASDGAGEPPGMRGKLQSNGQTSGKMSGSLSITGGSGKTWRVGRCRLTITDMHIGKPSPLAKLLYVLQLTDSEDFVFERMFVDSYIKNDHLLFEKFDLSGQSLAFSGSGFMDLPTRDVNLALTVRGKRLAEAEPSVLQSLAEGIGGGVVRMEVTGNAYDPLVEIKTLPVIEDSLQILGKKK